MIGHETASDLETEIRDAVIGGPAPFHQAQDLIITKLRGIDASASVDARRRDPGRRAIGVDRGSTIVTVGLEGWSPSLHAIRISKSVECAMTGDEDAAAETLIRGIAPVIAAQNARAAEGMRMSGRVEPFASKRTFGVDIEHLHLDRALVELCRSTTRIAWDRATWTIRDICLTVSTLYDGGPRVATNSGFIEETPQPNGRLALRIVGFPVHTHHDATIDPRIAPTFDGAHLVLPPAQVPDTVLAAMTGRPVGALVRVHEELDERIVTGITRDPDGGLRVSVEPDPVPVFAIERPA